LGTASTADTIRPEAQLVDDPDKRGMALVNFVPDRPGALWSDVIAAAARYELAPLSGRSHSVGVAGYTLGGGTGWLSRKYGFAADSLLRAEVVTASGETLTASATEHPHLFWALRGGGGNFGVVTRLEFRLRHWGGAMARPSPDAGPAGHRDVPFSVAALAPYDKGAPAERVDGHMDRLVARLRLHATGGSFLNFLTDPAMTRTAYTTHDYRRLTHAKRIWDPDNFFHRNHNIPPR
jgi:FAD/FMN-containing dehydrogenase